MDPFPQLIQRLTDEGVHFVLISGYAAALWTNEAGEDLELLQHSLSLTPEQRIEEDARFALFLEIVREAGEKWRHRNA